MLKFLDLNAQYQSIKEDIDQAVASVIRDSAFVGGKYCSEFEEEFARYHNCAECVGVSNGTDAIEIALQALDLPKGGEVLVPANTFIASSEAVTRSGQQVVFCDCDERDYTLSIRDLRKRLSSSTCAILAVHLYGQPCDMGEIISFARENGLKVIEDCAQAHGAEYKGQKVGGIGDVGTFSFYPGKILGAYGDAGAIVANNHEIARKCRMIANHGRIDKYDHAFEGRNSRLDGLQAAVLSAKLKHVEQWIECRIRIASAYRAALEGVGDVVLPYQPSWARSVYHLFVIRTTRREKLREYLAERNIETGIHYPISLPKLKAYEHLGQANEPMFANTADSTLLSLPIGEHIQPEDVEVVVAAVRDFYKHLG